MQFILDRLKEPSTYAGLGVILSLVGVHLSDVQMGAITSAAIAVAGAVAIFLPDKPGPAASK